MIIWICHVGIVECRWQERVAHGLCHDDINVSSGVERDFLLHAYCNCKSSSMVCYYLLIFTFNFNRLSAYFIGVRSNFAEDG
jgi:hypothetical protein